MNLQQLQNRRESLQRELRQIVEQINFLPYGCCIDCAFYQGSICTKFNQTPPEGFEQVAGQCDEWRADGYPAVLGTLTPEQALIEANDDMPF